MAEAFGYLFWLFIYPLLGGVWGDPFCISYFFITGAISVGIGIVIRRRFTNRKFAPIMGCCFTYVLLLIAGFIIFMVCCCCSPPQNLIPPPA